MKRNQEEAMHNNYIRKDNQFLSTGSDNMIDADETAMDLAMDEWEALKKADPTLEPKMEKEMERNFANLMKQLKDEKQDIEPTLEPVEPPVTKISRYRKYSKRLLLVAILGIVTAGMGISAVGQKQFMVKKVDSSQEINKLFWSDNKYDRDIGELKEVYPEIEKELGIIPIQLGYLPLGMKVDEVDFSGEYVNLIFKYKDQYIYFKQAKEDRNKMSEGRTSDRKESRVVHNLFLNQTIQIGENQLSNGTVEYEASWSTEEAYFYLDGIMEEEEFIKILEQLDYYNE